MKNFILIIGLVLLGFFKPVNAQLKLAIPFQPQIYYETNLKSIVYELHLMDSLKRPIEFLDFKICSESGILLNDATYNQVPKKKERNRYVKYIWIDINSIPDKLIHEISYRIDGEPYNLTRILTEFSDFKLTIGLPVRKGIWYMQAGPSSTSVHRATTIALKSRYDSTQNGFILGHCNQRFAIDFNKVGATGYLFEDNGQNNNQHYCYDEDVIAVSEGIVIGIIDTIQEHAHPPVMDKELNFSNITGNLVLLDIGNAIIASYTHLIPNSIVVNVGDTLVKGDLIGKVGNTGSSTGPHLHFHLSKPNYNLVDSTDILGLFWTSEGVSYVFDKYLNYNVVSGEFIEGETDYFSEPFVIDNPEKITNSLPYENNIIEVR